MQNILFLFDDSGAEVTLSGGDWDMPLDNLLDWDLTKVARSASLDLADTQFDVTLDATYYSRAVVLGPGNFSPTFQYRIRTFDDAARTEEATNTGWKYPAEDQDDATIHWGEPGYWLRDTTDKTYLIHVFDDVVPGRYWIIEIDDEDNDDGYVEAGKLFMPMGWQPSINYGYDGNGLNFRDNSLSSSTLSGGRVVWRRKNPRIFTCGFDYLPESEAYTQAYRFLEYVGFDRPLFVIPDPTDLVHINKRSFFCRRMSSDPISQVALNLASLGAQFEEII